MQLIHPLIIDAVVICVLQPLSWQLVDFIYVVVLQSHHWSLDDSYPIRLVPIPHLLDSNTNQRCTSPPGCGDYVHYSCFSLPTSSAMNVMTTYYSFRCASTRTATEWQCGIKLCYTLLDSKLTWTCTYPPPHIQTAFACECNAFLQML